jgi:hypothetical protein
MPAHSRLKNGVASRAYVAGIHDLRLGPGQKDVDGRNKSRHDDSTVARYCTSIPAFFTTSAHLAISVFMNGLMSASGMSRVSPAA